MYKGIFLEAKWTKYPQKPCDRYFRQILSKCYSRLPCSTMCHYLKLHNSLLFNRPNSVTLHLRCSLFLLTRGGSILRCQINLTCIMCILVGCFILHEGGANCQIRLATNRLDQIRLDQTYSYCIIFFVQVYPLHRQQGPSP